MSDDTDEQHAPLFVEHDNMYRGGCYYCAWLGPYRQRRKLAQSDARQHVVDVVRFPNPDIGKHG